MLTLCFYHQLLNKKLNSLFNLLTLRRQLVPVAHPVVLLTKHITKPLSAIVNLSFQAGVFPDNLKVAKVNPLDEKDSCDNLSNYRPNSILSAF